MRFIFCLVQRKIERERFGLLCCDGGEEKKVGGTRCGMEENERHSLLVLLLSMLPFGHCRRKRI